MNHKKMKIARNEKDLGIIVSDTLNWNENANRRHSKALRALWSLKRNLSSSTHMKSRLNAYIGNIVTIIMFGYISKTDLKLFEKLQKEKSKWICWSEPDSLYVELQRLLL